MELPKGSRADVAVAIATLLSAEMGALIAPAGRTSLDALGYLLPALGAALLVARRRAPLPVLVGCAAIQLIYQVRGYPGILPAVPVLVAVYTAVEYGHRIATVAIMAVGFVGGFSLVNEGPFRERLQERALLLGWVVAAGIFAEVTRHRTALLRQVEERAIEAERTREEVALRRAGEERLRIARELHDSLTHCISVIKVQAGVAVHLARKRGEPVPEALLAIQDASGEAMRELRGTLEVLRDDPRPGLDRLAELVERAKAAGHSTTVAVDGDRFRLPEQVDQAAYRIVQEALTNVARHAGPAATASVLVGYRPSELVLRIDDDGHGAKDAPPGVGLTGMRERVSALGGRLQTGPGPGGGFSVRAYLPLPAGEPT